MFAQEIPTKFAPAMRSPQQEIDRQVRYFLESELLVNFANSVPTILLVLNKNRQIVYANNVAWAALNPGDETVLFGQRPGEAIRCMHAAETEGGCGTTEFCRTCGAVKAVLMSQHGQANQQECRIIREAQLGNLDLRVAARPIIVHGERFTVFIATDIADEKRRKALERIFFHDVMNTAGALQGYIDLMSEMKEEEILDCVPTSQKLVQVLVDEIRAQRELTGAETNDIRIDSVVVESKPSLERLVELYRGHSSAKGRNLVLAENTENVELVTDPKLLNRVIGNMIKNALEASKDDRTITVGCNRGDEEIEIWVHNEGLIPREVQLQIFQRSFSTKGEGRGLGTYSVKLLGEKYLRGQVSFSTSLDDGTTFRIKLPFSMVKEEVR